MSIKWGMVVLAFIATGCATDGPHDISGTGMEFSKRVLIGREESHVKFVGDITETPRVERTELAWRDNSMREEYLTLSAGPASRGMLYVEFARAIFSAQSTAYIHDPANLQKTVKKVCGIEALSVKKGQNANGDFLYATCEDTRAFHCLVAVQGLNKRTYPGAVSGYTAIAEFRYCTRTEDDAKMLTWLGSVRVID